MMKQYLMVRDADSVILGAMLQDDPNAGPVERPASPAPDGVTLIACSDEFARGDFPETYAATYVDGAIVWTSTENLDEQRARKVADMSQSCADAILAGFVSSALGAAHTYPAKLTDQANLSASVLASILPSAGPDWSTPFWCADSAGDWQFRPHTAAQIQQVGVDAKVAILNCMNINQQLAAQIAAASAEQLQMIGWPA